MIDFNLAGPLALLFGGALFAGLLATPHCALMCGPLVLVFRRRFLVYQGARGLGYVLAGGLLGAIGYLLDFSGALINLQHLSIGVVALAAVAVLVGSRVRNDDADSPGWLSGRIAGCARHPGGSVVAGVLTAFLPCGMLYPLWALAAASGRAGSGALIGLGFFVGSVPGVLLFRGIAGSEFARRFAGARRAAPVVLLFLLGSVLLLRLVIAPELSFVGAASQGLCSSSALFELTRQ